MSRARLRSSSEPIAVVMAFVIGLIGTAAVGILLVDGRDGRPDFLFVGVGAVGAACAVVGVVFRSRVRALLAGGVGSAVAVAVVSGWSAWPNWLVLLWILLAVPYLAGFCTAMLLTGAFLSGVRHSPAAAALIAAVIVVVVGAGVAFVGPRLIGGPCMGTSIEQAATSYSNLQLDSASGGLRVSLDYQIRAAGQDAAEVGAAYYGAAVYDDDYITFLKKRLCFPAAVRSQVDSLTTAVDGRARVHRLLADDPFNTDLLAQLRSSQETVTVATVELRRVLGLPPLSEPSTAAPTPTPALPSAAPTAVPSVSPAGSAVTSASLPVRESAADGGGVLMEARPDGGLFVAMPAKEGTMIASLDATGRLRPGWPVQLVETIDCTVDADLADGSVRAICSTGDNGFRAFALDASARLMPGWPVDLPNGGELVRLGDSGIVDGDLLAVLLARGAGGETASLVSVSRDGSVRAGATVSARGAIDAAVVAPDGTAYISTLDASEPDARSLITGLGLDGVRPGWPTEVSGWASIPAFGPDGGVYVVVDTVDGPEGLVTDGASQVVAFDRTGRTLEGWPATIPIDTWTGREGGPTPPDSPVVTPDGSVYVVASGFAYALGPDGTPHAGWPYRLTATGVVGSVGTCPSGCGSLCGPLSSSPSLTDADGTLYLAQDTKGDTFAGDTRIVAIRMDGRVKPGRPVTLAQKGAWFETFAVSDTGTVFGYVIAPAGEGRTACGTTGRVYSGTVMAYDGQGDSVYSTTLVGP